VVIVPYLIDVGGAFGEGQKVDLKRAVVAQFLQQVIEDESVAQVERPGRAARDEEDAGQGNVC